MGRSEEEEDEAYALEEEGSDSDSLFEYASSCGSDEVQEDESDGDIAWEPSLGDGGVETSVVQLTGLNCCANRCLQGKEAAVEKAVFSRGEMSKEARRTSMLSALAISASLVATKRQRGRNVRDRYVYFLPFCGEVCKIAFQTFYDVSNDTLTRARNQVKAGHGYVIPHKNKGNLNARRLDEKAVATWLRNFAERVGDFCAVRFRHQETRGGVVRRYVTKQRILFFPAYFTWASLLKQYENYLVSTTNDATITHIPSLRSFQAIARERCRDIRIRAPQSNVCGICVLYRSVAAQGGTATDAENAGMHALDARAMREQYAKDLGSVGPKHVISTIDFAQNIALPHVSSTPSSWYFLSLIAVSLFGVFSENTNHQHNYIYSERAASKGSNEVNSLLHLHALSNEIYGSDKTWTIYADNCGGQNKNNHVIRFLLFLVATRHLKAANLYFYVKGHTKNNCDRGFGNIKRAYVKADLYTLEQVQAMINKSATTNTCVNLEGRQEEFKEWKTLLEPVYRDLVGIQSYQLFNVDAESPGIVYCRKRPSSSPVSQDLRRPGAVDYDALWSDLVPTAAPIANPEKVSDLHKKILPFIPVEYQTDPLYRAPTEAQVEASTARKRRRTRTTPTRLQRMQSEGKTQDPYNGFKTDLVV